MVTDRKILGLFYRLLVLPVMVVLLAGLFPLAASADIKPEEPWHPAAAAYARSLFDANLKPINWGLVEKEYSTSIQEPGYGEKSVYEMLRDTKKVAGVDQSAAIRQAIQKKDRQALYTAGTHAMSQITRLCLNEAEQLVKGRKSSKALEEILDGQRFYRAFGSFVKQTDPKAFESIGTAWLDLSNSVGSEGMLGIGGRKADLKTFADARKVIDSYLIANYEVSQFPAREQLVPVPAKSSMTTVATGLPPSTDMNDQDPLPRLLLNFEERGMDEKDLFLVAYGDMLFDSPEIFGGKAKEFGMTCSTCHNRGEINQKFSIPGLSHQAGAIDVTSSFFNPRANDMIDNSLDIPTIRGLRFTAPYGRDGRMASLRDFTRNVMVTEFDGAEPTPLMLDSLVAYMNQIDFLPAPLLNANGSLNNKASAPAKRGEKLFAQSCATCHIPGASFLDHKQHNIGSGDPATEFARDSLFDTPTLLGVNYTAPYFHDGSLATLADVVEWFNKKDNLKLNNGQKSDLVAYVEAVGTGKEPYEIFDEENTPFSLAWSELTTFASTLSTLIPAKDKYHAVLMIDTVAPDMRADVSGLKDRSQVAKVYEVADQLDAIKTAIQADDWDKAAKLWPQYQTLEAKYSPQLK